MRQNPPCMLFKRPATDLDENTSKLLLVSGPSDKSSLYVIESYMHLNEQTSTMNISVESLEGS